MKTPRLSLILGLAAFTLSAPPLRAQFNYQGRLTGPSGAPLADSNATVVFNIYAAETGGTPVWGPFTAVVPLTDGRFNVIIGPNDTNGTPRNINTAFGTTPRFLGIKVGTANEIAPRQQILAAPEAIHAQIADTVKDGAIGTAQLGPLAVTGANIAENTIEVSKLTGAGANFWSGDGTNVYRPGGNVGIGTSNPAARLHVNHANGVGVFAGNLAPFGDAGFETNFSGPATHMWLAENGTRVFSITNGNGYFSGNVGIGTTTPQAKLEVVGSTIINGETPPLVFEISGDRTTWRAVEQDVEKWVGDDDGCRIKFNFLNHFDNTVKCITEEIYMEHPGHQLASQGFKGHTFQLGGGETHFVLGWTTQNDIVPTPWNWMFVRNYKSPQVNAGVTGPPFANKYIWSFMVPPEITARVVIMDN